MIYLNQHRFVNYRGNAANDIGTRIPTIQKAVAPGNLDRGCTSKRFYCT